MNTNRSVNPWDTFDIITHFFLIAEVKKKMKQMEQYAMLGAVGEVTCDDVQSNNGSNISSTKKFQSKKTLRKLAPSMLFVLLLN